MTMLIRTVINCSVNNFLWKVPAPPENTDANTHVKMSTVCMASQTKKKGLDLFFFSFFFIIFLLKEVEMRHPNTLTSRAGNTGLLTYVSDDQRENGVPSVHSHC